MLPTTDITLQEPQAESGELGAEAASVDAQARRGKPSAGGLIARAALVLMAGTILSRVLGLGREVAIADLFGGGAKVDAFTIANHISTIIYDLIIAGTVSAALVPVFSEYSASKEQRPEFGRVVSTILTVAGTFLSVSVALLEVVAEPLVSFMGAGFSPATHSLALVMT